ncbi:Rne/Rng family ribonuclease [Arthrobacter sp. R4-81]
MDKDQVAAVNVEAAEAPEAPKKATRTRRKAIPKTQAVTAEGIPIDPDATRTDTGEAAAPEKAAPAKRSRARKPVESAVAEEAAVAGEAAAADEPAVTDPALEDAPKKKPVRRRASRAKAAVAEVEDETTETAPEAEEAPTDAVQSAGAAVTAPGQETEAAEEQPEAQEAADDEQPKAETPAVGSLFLEPGSVTSMIFQAPDLSTVVRPVPAPVVEDDDETENTSDEGELDESGNRRRRRSRGRRGRSRGTEREAGDETEDTDGDAGEAEADEQGTAGLGDGVTSRRRRRRRRGDQDIELTGGGDDDPPNTVTRVRAPRAVTEAPVSNRVTSVKGSTRLEAKKQRRRESRDTGRRRTVITEAEFLARRESVDRQMIVRQRDDRIQIAVLEDGVLAEHFVSKTQQDSLIGNVYLGKVQNVLPSMEAAFVDIGRGRNAVLYAGEVNWDVASLEGKQRRIENALKSGDSVLVQVTKDPVGHKGARLTSQISLPGRYLVYVPGGSMTGISRKLPDVERNRLKRILKDRLPEDAGVIVRTAAEGASEEELTHDINRLRAQWEGIESQATSTKVLAPELLYGEPDLTIKVVRDVFNEDFSKLIVSGEEAWDTIEAYVTYVAPDLVGRLEKWTKDQDIFSAWRIDEQIHKALDRKVFLPSGGSLVIDRTEAMTVVDVNTGKFTGSGGNLEETVTKNNLEAAEEVVRQLRLRDIGGIIVIDFIDMVLESNRDLVLRRMVECLGRDRTKHQVAEVTSLGLVQMTRKRMGTGLLEVFGEQCEHCTGRGVVTHDEPVEHRRANTVAAEHYVPRAEVQPAARTERKRRRGKGGQALGEPLTLPAPVHAEPTDAERHAKAEATRAALANIAAAAHAAHLHDDDVQAARASATGAEREAVRSEPAAQAPSRSRETSRPQATEPVQAGSDAGRTGQGDDTSGGRPATVLTFGGERVVLPFVDHAGEASTGTPELTLDLLAEAFAHLGEQSDQPQETEETRKPVTAPVTAPEVHAAPIAAGSSSRRGRRNRSASRAQGAANETAVEQNQDAPAATGSTHAAKAPAAPAKPATTASEPIILGVGVPASEL